MSERLFIGDPHVHVDRSRSGEYVLYAPNDISNALSQHDLDFIFPTSHAYLPVEEAEESALMTEFCEHQYNGVDVLIQPSIEYNLRVGRSSFHAALIPDSVKNVPHVSKDMTLSELEDFIRQNPRWSSFLYHAGLSAFMADTQQDDIAVALESPAIHGMEVFNATLVRENYPIQRSSHPLHVLQDVRARTSKALAYIGGTDSMYPKDMDTQIGSVLMEVRAESVSDVPEALRTPGKSVVVVKPSMFPEGRISELRRAAPEIDDYVQFR